MLNTEYWNNEGAKKIFSHPICSEWMAHLDRNASILDIGCGYGRLTPYLTREGFQNITGYDPSGSLIERALQENPGAFYSSNSSTLYGKSFDLILCFALFTSCPSQDEQSELVSIINQLSQRNKWLYISDYEIRDNPHYQDRYEQRKLNIYGCFSSGNAVFRHHMPGHFDSLFSNWKRQKERQLNSKTHSTGQ